MEKVEAETSENLLLGILLRISLLATDSTQRDKPSGEQLFL